MGEIERLGRRWVEREASSGNKKNTPVLLPEVKFVSEQKATGENGTRAPKNCLSS